MRTLKTSSWNCQTCQSKSQKSRGREIHSGHTETVATMWMREDRGEKLGPVTESPKSPSTPCNDCYALWVVKRVLKILRTHRLTLKPIPWMRCDPTVHPPAGELCAHDAKSARWTSRPKITILTWVLIILGSESEFMKTRIFILLWSKMLLRRAKFKYVAWSITKMNFKILRLRIRLTFSSSHGQYCFVYFYPQTSYNLNVQLNSKAQSK